MFLHEHTKKQLIFKQNEDDGKETDPGFGQTLNWNDEQWRIL